MIKYTPTLGVTQMSTVFPGSRAEGSAAIWAHGKAYVFGVDGDRVYEYDPDADSVAIVASFSPRHRFFASAVYDGRYAYVFGGGGEYAAYTNEIMRFDPITKEYAPLPAVLPTPRSFTTAIWANAAAYIFGGYYKNPDDSSVFVDDILRFDPRTNIVTKVAALPSPRAGASAVFDGTNAIIFGGIHDLCLETLTCEIRYYDSGRAEYYDSIYKFNPTDLGLTRMDSSLPYGRGGTSVAWAGQSAYLFGGLIHLPWGEGVRGRYLFRGEDETTWDIMTYSPVPAFPEEFHSNTSPDGSTTLSWNLPKESSYSPPIATYRVYRRTEQTEFAQIAEVNSLMFRDPDCPSFTCTYSVSAVNISGEGPMAPAVPRPPAAPTVAARTGPGRGQITLSWEGSFDEGRPIQTWKVYSGSDPNTISFDRESGASVTTVTFDDLPDGARRYFRVTGVSAAGEGAASAVRTGVSMVAPGPPTNPTGNPVPYAGANKIYWYRPAAASEFVTAYRIYRSDFPSARGLIGQTDNRTFTFSDTGCRLATVCQYYITAINPVGEGPYSEAVVLTGWR